MIATVDIQIAHSDLQAPDGPIVNTWVNAVLAAAAHSEASEIAIRVVDKSESRALNHQYRHKNAPTNVLSFPCQLPEGVDLPLLGDLVICAEIVEEEAAQQAKTFDAHWAHMIVHGTLHLLGFDHEQDADAEKMESLESKILTELGFSAPYE